MTNLGVKFYFRENTQDLDAARKYVYGRTSKYIFNIDAT